MNFKKLAQEAYLINEQRLRSVKEGFSNDPNINAAEREAYQVLENLSIKLQKKYHVGTYVTIFSSGNMETSVRIDIGKTL